MESCSVGALLVGVSGPCGVFPASASGSATARHDRVRERPHRQPRDLVDALRRLAADPAHEHPRDRIRTEAVIGRKQIVFVRKKAAPNVFPDETIWVMNVNGSDQHEVFAPPRRRGAGATERHPRQRSDMVAGRRRRSRSCATRSVPRRGAPRDERGRTATAVCPSVPRRQVDRVFDHVWSPDGTEIAYSFDFVCCLSHIDVSKVDGSDTRILIGPRNAVDIQTFELGARLVTGRTRRSRSTVSRT